MLVQETYLSHTTSPPALIYTVPILTKKSDAGQIDADISSNTDLIIYRDPYLDFPDYDNGVTVTDKHIAISLINILTPEQERGLNNLLSKYQ